MGVEPELCPAGHPDLLVWLQTGLDEGWWDDNSGRGTVEAILDELRVTWAAVIEAADDPSTSQALTYSPNLEDPTQVMAKRTMDAIQAAFKAEFGDDNDRPNITMVVSFPPAGRVAVASTEPGVEWIYHAFVTGFGSVKRSIRLQAESN